MFFRACLAILLATASAALAAPRESVTFTAVTSNGPLNDPVNELRTATFVGGYTLGRLDFSGTLTSQHSRTWSSDVRILVTTPGGQTATIQPVTTGGTFTTATFSGSIFMPVGTDFGTWSFRFYEAFDDGGTAAIDALVTITVTLTDDPPQPPSAINLGTIITPGQTVAGATVPASGYRWYKFHLDRAVSADLARYLDIDTLGTNMPASGSGPLQDDTELMLFNSAGVLIASDDDSGDGLISQLSFGLPGRPATGGGLPFDGQNGPLAAGDYYLAVGPYHLIHTPPAWGVLGTSPRGGTIALRFLTNVPAGSDCEPPIVQQNPDSTGAFPESPVSFSVSADGTAPLSYQWRRNGTDLTDGGFVLGATSPSLTITSAQPTDNGVYDVRITNACGSVLSNTASLSVYCISDFNGDSDSGTDADIEAFFLCLAGNCCQTCGVSDFDGDGDFGTDADIESFFRVLAGGSC